MAGLNPLYIVTSDLEEYFVDKTTGLPLAAGQVFFWSDLNRSTPKPVYTISGTPPNYVYTALPNPVTLSAVGTFQDGGGNNVVPYYFPYTDSTGDVLDLYFIQVFDSGGNLQFTREGWPNVTINTEPASGLEVLNHIPNGQFLLHNYLPGNDLSSPIVAPGQLTTATTNIAPGGWYVEKSGTTSTDFVLFPRYGSFVSNPASSPRYACNFSCTAPGSDAIKYLSVRFNDVNKFASTTDFYTFTFTAISNSGSTLNVNIVLLKNFGSGGSGTTSPTVGTQTIGLAYDTFNTPILFGNNTGQTIGTNDDDYVEVVISFPPTSTFNVTITDCILTFGDLQITGFPTTTNSEFIAATLPGSLPLTLYDNSNLYLPIIQTLNGFGYDSSNIGKVYGVIYTPAASLSTTTNEMYLDGSTYETIGYSSIGVPFSRLQAKLWNSTLKVPNYGTGDLYAVSYVFSATTSIFELSTNQAGAQTLAVEGAIPTGFTFLSGGITTGAGSFGVNGYVSGASGTVVTVIGTVIGTASIPTANTSPFTVTDITNNVAALHVFTISIPSIPTAAQYFEFSSTTTDYFMWFRVDGSGTVPAGTGTAIQVNILSTYTTAELATVISQAISGSSISQITTTAGSTITPGSFFRFTANGTTYTPWYKVSGVGTAPSVGTLNIEVDILTADTAAQIADKTRVAINMKYFGIPDFRGLFLIGVDPNSQWDITTGRWSLIGNALAGALGTFERTSNLRQDLNFLPTTGVYDTTIMGVHSAATPPAFQGVSPGTSLVGGAITLTPQGDFQSRPYNANVNWVVKY